MTKRIEFTTQNIFDGIEQQVEQLVNDDDSSMAIRLINRTCHQNFLSRKELRRLKIKLAQLYSINNQNEMSNTLVGELLAIDNKNEKLLAISALNSVFIDENDFFNNYFSNNSALVKLMPMISQDDSASNLDGVFFQRTLQLLQDENQKMLKPLRLYNCKLARKSDELVMLLLTKKLAEAIKVIDEILADKIIDNFARANILSLQGKCYCEIEQINNAVESFNKALKCNKACFEAQSQLYKIAIASKNDEKAEEILINMAFVESQEPKENLSAIKFLCRHKRLKTALVKINKLVKNNLEICEYQKFFAIILYNIGCHELARNRFVELSENSGYYYGAYFYIDFIDEIYPRFVVKNEFLTPNIPSKCYDEQEEIDYILNLKDDEAESAFDDAVFDEYDEHGMIMQSENSIIAQNIQQEIFLMSNNVLNNELAEINVKKIKLNNYQFNITFFGLYRKTLQNMLDCQDFCLKDSSQLFKNALEWSLNNTLLLPLLEKVIHKMLKVGGRESKEYFLEKLTENISEYPLTPTIYAKQTILYNLLMFCGSKKIVLFQHCEPIMLSHQLPIGLSEAKDIYRKAYYYALAYYYNFSQKDIDKLCSTMSEILTIAKNIEFVPASVSCLSAIIVEKAFGERCNIIFNLRKINKATYKKYAEIFGLKADDGDMFNQNEIRRTLEYGPF